VDREALLDRLGGDETILLEIVKIFLEDTPQLLASMESAEAAGDAKTLRRLAHSLKGSAGTVGATALQASALGLEQAVDGGDLQAAREMIPGVRAHFSVVQSVMSAWAPGGDAA
jgi:HPt (histidine-containing phosphotransfer) domain-containing protein